MKNFIRFLIGLIFWAWNLLFLLLMYAGILPFIGVGLVIATFEGIIPLEFTLTLLAFFTVPTACAILGGAKVTRSSPLRLLSLFYGIEAPLFLLLLLRLFLIRERTAASTFLLATFLACIAAFAIELFYGYAERRRAAAYAQLVGHTLMLFAAVYVAALLMFYAAPLAVAFFREFFKFDWLFGLFEFFKEAIFHPVFLIWGLIWLLFFLFSLTIFIGMPAAFMSLYSYSGLRIWQRFAAQHGLAQAVMISAAVTLLWFAGFDVVNRQPQREAFSLLEQAPQTDAMRQRALKHADLIRKGLLNAYLSSYRYLSPANANNQIEIMYQDVLKLSDAAAKQVQAAQNWLLSPFLYDGDADDDRKAADLYAKFFDTPIQRGEQRAVRQAISSTYNGDEVKAGLMNINEEKVWLSYQQVTIDPHGDWANVELYEVYENQTPEEQEVFYSFSLPESAVMTGLWLGNSADRATRFAFQVSPRGAAQQVYNEQVRIRRDPALLEQVGTRHYRLRAFPVPASPLASERLWRGRVAEIGEPAKLHLWLTYKVLRHADEWPLPDVGEKRNVYWTKKTRCNYNGYEVRHSGNDWLPAHLKANLPAPPAPHDIALPGGYRVTAAPVKPEEYALPSGKRFALLIDTSYSMTQQAEQVKKTVNWLNAEIAPRNAVDVYLIDAQPELSRRVEFLGKTAFNIDGIVFYGTVQFKEILSRFAALRGETAYDAILLLTDEGSYELADNEKTLPAMPAPLWMVHVGGLPKAYDDATLHAIESSGGGVGTDAREVLQRMATTAAAGDSVISLTDGYLWRMESPAAQETPLALMPRADWQNDFEPLAARQLLVGISKRRDLSALANLDAVHALARHFQIVSPYSSMIVLVNEQQKNALKEAEARADRFEREVEHGQETLGKPSNPMHVPDASAVPEPETWLLLSTGILAMIWLRRRRKSFSTN